MNTKTKEAKKVRSGRKPKKFSTKKSFYIETYLRQIIPIYFRTLRIASGYCYNPAGPTPKILVSSQLLPRKKLNVLIEEITHAFFYSLPEYKVRKFSAQLGRVIYSLFLKK